MSSAGPWPVGGFVRRDGFTLPARVTQTVDVLFDGRRIWSVAPRNFDPDQNGQRWIAWPKMLHLALHGDAAVTLVEHHSRKVLAVEDVSFDDSGRRFRFEGVQGVPQVIDKWGMVQRPFEHQTPVVRAALLDAAEKILKVLNEECSLPTWLAFGSLLGAVRDGQMIVHDSDIDLAYLSQFEHPMDVTREMFRLSRALQARGMLATPRRGSLLAVSVPTEHGLSMPIDVYACFYIKDVLYETASVGAPIPREAILPLSTVSFEGRAMPAPANPEVILEASYGSSWRVPDPAFAYRKPRALKRRFQGWFPQSSRHRHYFERLYEGFRGTDISQEPSAFAQWVLPQLRPGTEVNDVGCGDGRDSLWFARHSHPVTGLDYASTALELCRQRAMEAGISVTYDFLNLYDYRVAVTRGALIAHRQPAPRTVYARFLLDALEANGRATFWHFLDMVLRGRGTAFLEFRTHRNAVEPHAVDTFQKLLDPDQVVREIRSAGGRVMERVEAAGLARDGDEDPDICRLSVTWER